MNPRKTLAKARNNPSGLRFSEFESLVEAFGFRFVRQTGSHRIYGNPDVPVALNLQPDHNGKAKAYQVRDLLQKVEQYGLSLEDGE